MRELRFSQSVYSGRSIDEALGHFERFGQFERDSADGYWIVRVTGRDAQRTRRLAGELANYALGLTVERGGPDPGPPGDPGA